MQYELPKLGLRKTKIKERPCSNSLEMFKRRCSSLKNGWVSDVFPLDYIQVFSSKLTSDSSFPLKRVVLLCFVFTCHENVAGGFLRAVTAGESLAYWLFPCIKLEIINMIWVGGEFMPLMLILLTSVVSGESDIYRKFCFESATQEGTIITLMLRCKSRTVVKDILQETRRVKAFTILRPL